NNSRAGGETFSFREGSRWDKTINHRGHEGTQSQNSNLKFENLKFVPELRESSGYKKSKNLTTDDTDRKISNLQFQILISSALLPDRRRLWAVFSSGGSGAVRR